MPEPGPESTERGATVLWRTLVPSLAVLSGIFFFINAACMNDSGSAEYPGESDGPTYPGCTAGAGITPPAGASVTILEPSSGQELSDAATDGTVEVAVKLRASGIGIASPTRCLRGSGHYMLAVQRVADGACVEPVMPLELTDGTSEATLRLWSGTYLLTVQVLNANGLAFQPAVSDDVRFVVAGVAPRQDGGVCP